MNLTAKQFVELRTRAGASIPSEYARPSAEHIRNTRRKELDGISFRSTLEAETYALLKLWEQAGAISCLTTQPRFLLQESFVHNGTRIREMNYTADFQFVRDGKTVILESKGFRTQPYAMRRKLFLARYPHYQFEEWTRETLREMQGR